MTAHYQITPDDSSIDNTMFLLSEDRVHLVYHGNWPRVIAQVVLIKGIPPKNWGKSFIHSTLFFGNSGVVLIPTGGASLTGGLTPVTCNGGWQVMAETRKFIAMSSQFIWAST